MARRAQTFQVSRHCHRTQEEHPNMTITLEELKSHNSSGSSPSIPVIIINLQSCSVGGTMKTCWHAFIGHDHDECGLLLDVVIKERALVLQLLTVKVDALLVWWGAFFVLDFSFHVCNRVGSMDLQQPPVDLQIVGPADFCGSLDKDLQQWLTWTARATAPGRVLHFRGHCCDNEWRLDGKLDHNCTCGKMDVAPGKYEQGECPRASPNGVTSKKKTNFCYYYLFQTICLDQLLRVSAEINCSDFLLRSAVGIFC